VKGKNSTLEDLGAVLGIKATLRLSIWYGGKNLYIPKQPLAYSKLVGLIGIEKAQLLCDEWPSQNLAIPTTAAYDGAIAEAAICLLRSRGTSNATIAVALGISARRVQQIVVDLIAQGLDGVEIFKGRGTLMRAYFPRLRKAGVDPAEIALALNLTPLRLKRLFATHAAWDARRDEKTTRD
jgi:hypothetical protein